MQETDVQKEGMLRFQPDTDRSRAERTQRKEELQNWAATILKSASPQRLKETLALSAKRSPQEISPQSNRAKGTPGSEEGQERERGRPPDRKTDTISPESSPRIDRQCRVFRFRKKFHPGVGGDQTAMVGSETGTNNGQTAGNSGTGKTIPGSLRGNQLHPPVRKTRRSRLFKQREGEKKRKGKIWRHFQRAHVWIKN